MCAKFIDPSFSDKVTIVSGRTSYLARRRIVVPAATGDRPALSLLRRMTNHRILPRTPRTFPRVHRTFDRAGKTLQGHKLLATYNIAAKVGNHGCQQGR